MLAIPIVKPLVKPLAKPVVVSGILTYVKGGLVLDLTRAFNEDSTTINDRSPESNDATLYSGRYASTNGVAGKAINAKTFSTSSQLTPSVFHVLLSRTTGAFDSATNSMNPISEKRLKVIPCASSNCLAQGPCP